MSDTAALFFGAQVEGRGYTKTKSNAVKTKTSFFRIIHKNPIFFVYSDLPGRSVRLSSLYVWHPGCTRDGVTRNVCHICADCIITFVRFPTFQQRKFRQELFLVRNSLLWEGQQCVPMSEHSLATYFAQITNMMYQVPATSLDETLDVTP